MKLLIAAFCAILTAGTSTAAQEGIPIQYMDSRGRAPSAPGETAAFARRSQGGFSASVASGSATSANLVLVIVDSSVYPGIEQSISTYLSDLQADGYSTTLLVVTDPVALDLRTTLQDYYSQGSLVGGVLVGNIPTGWMENGDGEYPIDLYLMDMNGTWTDADSDGLFESASSNWGPEIWVGRLTPTWLSFGTSEELLENYFAKNHAYRQGTLSLPDRALAYEEAFTGLTGYLSLLYGDVVTKSSPSGTTADDFRAELLNGYEWVHLIAHSSPWGSSFHVGAPPSGAGTLNSYEAVPLDPHALFYVLNCCTNGRWTEIDNLANCYIWADTYGLAVIAQAKTDYTNDFQELYQTMASGACIGEGFRVWLAANLGLENAGVLLGDPTLKPHGNGLSAGLGQYGHPGSGTDFWTPSRLTAGIHSEGDADAFIDTYSGEVFAAFGTSETVRANILATHSQDDTWIVPMQVCEHEYWDWHPAVGGNGQGLVWTAWHSMNENIYGYDIFVSAWNGGGWAAATQLTSTDAFEVEPAVAGGNGKGWVVWQRWASGESCIEGRMWTGTTWTTTSSPSDYEGDERCPDLARSASGYGLVYQAERNGNLVVGFRDAPDSGPFGSETVISGEILDCREPAIASDGEGFWAVWEQAGCIMARHRSGDGTWGPIESVCSSGTASRPAVASPGGETAAAAWLEDGTGVCFCIRTSSGWGPALDGASAPAVESVALAFRSVSDLEVVYGARDADLHWDIWTASLDPSGVGEGGSGAGPGVSITLLSPNPGPVALFSIEAGEDARISIFDASGRIIHSGSAGSGSCTWPGAGESVPGVYFAMVTDGGSRATVRFVLLDRP